MDSWARAAAASDEGITKLRQLISRIKTGIEDLWHPTKAPASTTPPPSSASTAPSASACPVSARRPREDTKGPSRDQPSARFRQGREDANRPPGRLSAPPPARHHRDQAGQLQRQREQRLRHRPCRPVDRTVLYWHRHWRRDFLGKIHALKATPPAAGEAAGPAVTRASLQADLLAAHELAARLGTRSGNLKRPSEALGEQALRESGLGAPADIDALNHKISQPEQQAAALRIQLSEREDELAAARSANRELVTRIDHTPQIR